MDGNLSLTTTTPPPLSVWPHLFCGAGHDKRSGEQLEWSVAFRLYIGSFVFHVHSYQDQFIQPCWAECVIYLAKVCILCVCIALICLCVPILLCFPGQLSHLLYMCWRWRN